MARDNNRQNPVSVEIMKGFTSILSNLAANPSDAAFIVAEKQLTTLRDTLREDVAKGTLDHNAIADRLVSSLQWIATSLQTDESDAPVCTPDEAYSICPLTGRYSSIGKDLSTYFSEYALVNYRVKVEVMWLIYLLKNIHSEILDSFEDKEDVILKISSITEMFEFDDFMRVKKIEMVTKHDVKACELFVADCLKEMGFEKLVSYVHIGCTSEDITNLAYGCMINDFLKKYYIPLLEKLVKTIEERSLEYKDDPMLAHTHGQPATPTTFGKEMEVLAFRFKEQLKKLYAFEVKGKFNGATGNYAAISVAFPDVCWPKEAQKFVEEYIGLSFSPVTTQIENQDYITDLLDIVRHINNIDIDLANDMWLYIMLFYGKLKVVKTEVGSSTMPHKVNPIAYENSMGNAEISNGLSFIISNFLPKSNMQRDLKNSTILRNLGLVFGYSVQAIKEVIKGLGRTSANTEKMALELDNTWAVLGEAIQTVLRKNGNPNAYNALKELTRGKEVTAEIMKEFINSLDIPDDDKQRLLELTPAKYTGYAAYIAEQYATTD